MQNISYVWGMARVKIPTKFRSATGRRASGRPIVASSRAANNVCRCPARSKNMPVGSLLAFFPEALQNFGMTARQQSQ